MTRRVEHHSDRGALQGPRAPRWTAAAAAAILVLAGWLDFAAGRRGLFAFDQSILFDGAHRILSGQVPFRDFVLPFGPVAPLLQALLLALLGTGWHGYLLSAAVANAVAAGLGMLLLRRVLPDRPLLWLLGGLLTAIWFYPPSGTPWFDQYAFLFVLAGALLLSPTILDDHRSRLALPAAGLAGACWALAFLTKQNAGVASIPLFLLLLAIPFFRPSESRSEVIDAGRTPALAWGVGAAVIFTGFATWLALEADPSLFLRHGIQIPGAEGMRRLRQSPLGLLAVHSVGTGAVEARAVVLGSALVAAGTAASEILRARGRRSLPDPRLLAAGALGAGFFLVQHLFAVTSSNQPQISASFSGLLLALAAGSLLRFRSRVGEPGISRETIPLVALVGGIVLAANGIRASFDRVAHDLFSSETTFERPLEARKLEVIRWGEPTVLEGPHTRGRAVVRADAVELLVSTLSRRPGRFFVFPDWTLLYGILGRPAPQPILWFHEGLTYPRNGAHMDDEAGGSRPLGRWLVGELEDNRVQTIVLEEISWLGTEPRLSDFPELIDHLQRCFEAKETIGIFRLYARRSVCEGPDSSRSNPPSEEPSESPHHLFSRAGVAP